MTSIAVTASVCASASEAALLVASFMSNSLDLGTAHRRAKHAQTTADDFYSEPPATSIRSDESPLSDNRQSQNRAAIRRQFGPRAAGLCARQGVFWEQSPGFAVPVYSLRARFRPSSCPGIAAGSVTGYEQNVEVQANAAGPSGKSG